MSKPAIRQYFSGVIVLIILFFISRINFLLFHTMAEAISIIIAFAVFMFAWNTRKFLNSNYLLYIGISFIFVGFIDLLHTITYGGMNIIPLPDDQVSNVPTQLWIAARYLQSLSLLIAPFFIKKKLNLGLVVSIYHLIIIGIILSIFYWHNFPDCYLNETGLTVFKKISEYLISLVLLAAIINIWRQKTKFDSQLRNLMTLSIAATILSELSFTLYSGVYDLTNVIGHLFKISSFFLIYKAIIVAGITQPVEVLFHDLNHSKLKLMEHKKQLESEVKKAVAEVEERNKMLILQSRHAQLGEMIAAITHQWKQPLNQISVLSTALMDAWNYDALDKEFLEKSIGNISSVVYDMNAILDNFRNFYVPLSDDIDFELADVQLPLQAMVGKRLLKYDIELKYNIKPGIIITGKLNEIVQVLLILINNAVDAINVNQIRPGHIEIIGSMPNKFISIIVRDNAGGIKPEVMDKLFTPYFTTKGKEGTGMGLFLARTIIEKHFGGSIRAGNCQQGAEFTCQINKKSDLAELDS
jgi:signal transduction histidine kinase